MRLVFIVEGETEQNILKEFFAPYIAGFSKVETINARGVGKLKQEFKTIAELELLNQDTVVFCLFDLYEAPFKLPHYISSNADPNLAIYKYIQKYMKDQISEEFRERFFSFPVMQEVETWLLADFVALQAYFGKSIKPYPSPESIVHPANEIKQMLWKFKKQDNYSKALEGKRLFSLASAERVYNDSCPHFEEIINQLLILQGKTPPKLAPPKIHIDLSIYEELARLQYEIDAIWAEIDNNFHTMSNEQIAAYEQQIKTLEQELEAAQIRLLS